MTEGTRLVVAARFYLGTPFVHQGRCHGAGVDCVGLFVCAARDIGKMVLDRNVYTRNPNGRGLIRELSKQLVRVSSQGDPLSVEPDLNCLDGAQDGDVIAFWRERPNLPRHVAIKSDVGMIHTWSEIGRVVEHSLDNWWAERAHSRWRLA